ncbi:hypothetical protein JHW43_005392 [Diplocarpon mali]|nr:hypothetical protein JHW43_005392 [Diplocarpon mali]
MLEIYIAINVDLEVGLPPPDNQPSCSPSCYQSGSIVHHVQMWTKTPGANLSMSGRLPLKSIKTTTPSPNCKTIKEPDAAQKAHVENSAKYKSQSRLSIVV